MVSKEQLAYLAGLVDGEGYIGIERVRYADKRKKGRSKKFTRYKLRITIANTDPRPLKLIQNTFKGTMIIGNKKDSYRPCFVLQLFSQRAEDFIRSILPYLIIKKEQAVLALEFRQYQKSNHGRGSKAYNALMSQKKSGYMEDLKRVKRVAYLM